MESSRNPNSKPPINVVVFEYEQNGSILKGTAASETNKDQAVLLGLKTLEEVQCKSSYPITVLRIYSEWKPSEGIIALITEKFPTSKLTYSFDEESKLREEIEEVYKDSPKEKKWWEFWKG